MNIFQTLFLISVFYMNSCTQKLNHNLIQITIDESGVIELNSEKVELDSLTNKLKLEISRMDSNGIKKEQMIVSLQTDPNAKMGTVFELAAILKNLNLNKLEYYELKKE